MDQPRLRTLRDRHTALDARIGREAARPLPDSLELARLKRAKLRLKEEMERMRTPPGPTEEGYRPSA